MWLVEIFAASVWRSARHARKFYQLHVFIYVSLLFSIDYINKKETHAYSVADIEDKFGDILQQLDWVSLGGGIHFIAPDYPLEKLAERLKRFSEKYGVQVYLEPGEVSIHGAGSLVTTVLDTLHNKKI